MSVSLDGKDTRAAQIRLAAGVIIATMVLWMGFSFLGGALDWARRWAFLADLAALAAFAWAGLVLFRLWNTRDEDG